MWEFLPRLFLIFLLVFLNGFFVASEFALVAVRKTRIDELVRKGDASAKRVQSALKDLDTYISSTQLGITLASLALGWIAEPTIAELIEPFFSALPAVIASFTSHSLAITIAFLIITFLHIVLGELVPKSLALQKSIPTSLLIIAPLQLFTTIFKPFIALLNLAGTAVLKLFGLHSANELDSTHSEEEVKMIIAQSAQKGIFEKHEVAMVYKVLQFTDMPIQQVMIPRTDIIAFDSDEKVKEIFKKMKKYGHSRFPIYEKNVDDIIGFIHVKDLYPLIDTAKENKQLDQLHIIRKIIHINETKPADEVLYDMRKRRIHIAVINDEYGGTAGIVTLEDIIESIIGDIRDEFESPEKDIEKQKDGKYIVSGLTTISRVNRKINLPLKGQGYTTIGGLVYGILGRTPVKGDKVQIGSVVMKVLSVNGRRINKILLTTT